MTKQLKTIEILNPSKSATCSMWRYPESAKIFQYRGMDFDGFRVVRVKKGAYWVRNKSLRIRPICYLVRGENPEIKLKILLYFHIFNDTL